MTERGFMFNLIDTTPLIIFVLFAVGLGLAPFVPEPHLFEKTRMLMQGQLVKPIDIFDLLFHLAPIVALGVKLVRMLLLRETG